MTGKLCQLRSRKAAARGRTELASRDIASSLRCGAAKPAFDSLIPEVMREMEQDEARAELDMRMELGQLALTAAEAAEREAVLKRLGAPPWLTVMKVRC